MTKRRLITTYTTSTPKSRRIHARLRSTSPASLTTPIVIADEVRLGLDRRNDERYVGLGERVAELPLLAVQQLGHLRIAQHGFVVSNRVVVELGEAANQRFVG